MCVYIETLLSLNYFGVTGYAMNYVQFPIGYRSEYWYWEGMVLLRKLVLAASSVWMVGFSPLNQVC